MRLRSQGTHGPAQVLVPGDYFEPESYAASKRGHGTPQSAGVSAGSAHRTWESDFESWAKESFEIATRIAYGNGADWNSQGWKYRLRYSRSGYGKPASAISLATLTFLIFFYSTTLLTSYFYPLDWAPIAFELSIGGSLNGGGGNQGKTRIYACPL